MYVFDFSNEKNEILRETRGVCFEDVIEAVEKGNVVGVLQHWNPAKFPNQRVMVVKIRNYIYAVPYIKDEKRKVLFLKTVYPSRVLNRKYSKKGASYVSKKEG